MLNEIEWWSTARLKTLPLFPWVCGGLILRPRHVYVLGMCPNIWSVLVWRNNCVSLPLNPSLLFATHRTYDVLARSSLHYLHFQHLLSTTAALHNQHAITHPTISNTSRTQTYMCIYPPPCLQHLKRVVLHHRLSLQNNPPKHPLREADYLWVISLSWAPESQKSGNVEKHMVLAPVSYTHLTLPTICSV